MYFKALGQRCTEQKKRGFVRRKTQKCNADVPHHNKQRRPTYLLLLQNMKPPIAATANTPKRHPTTAPATTPSEGEQVLLTTHLPLWL